VGPGAKLGGLCPPPRRRPKTATVYYYISLDSSDTALTCI